MSDDEQKLFALLAADLVKQKQMRALSNNDLVAAYFSPDQEFALGEMIRRLAPDYLTRQEH